MLLDFLYSAKAQIKGGKEYSKIDGIATFRKVKSGILFTIKVKGLPQSKNSCKGRFFGLHIHEGNSCSGNLKDEFKDSKSHLNLTNCSHPFHTGDLPPLIENKGNAYMSVLIDKFKIDDIIGKVLIIHDLPDDFTSQPSRKFR